MILTAKLSGFLKYVASLKVHRFHKVSTTHFCGRGFKVMQGAYSMFCSIEETTQLLWLHSLRSECPCIFFKSYALLEFFGTHSVTTGQETSQNHRLKTSQSDQRAHLCVLCCLTKHINPFRDFKTKICGAPIIK